MLPISNAQWPMHESGEPRAARGASADGMYTPLARAARLLACHRQSTSTRLRYLRLPWGMTLFERLPVGARLAEPDADIPLQAHPAACAHLAVNWLSLPQASIIAEADFQRRLRLPDGGLLEVLLLRFTQDRSTLRSCCTLRAGIS